MSPSKKIFDHPIKVTLYFPNLKKTMFEYAKILIKKFWRIFDLQEKINYYILFKSFFIINHFNLQDSYPN